MSEAALPEGWVEAQLGDGLLSDVQPGFACGAHSRDRCGVPHLRPMNVTTEGQIVLDDVKFIVASEVDREARWIRPGDVLFNNTNSPELVGKTAYYGEDEPRAFSNHMTRVRPNRVALDAEFLATALHQRWREGHFAAACNNHVSQASISRTVLLETIVRFPPLAEQRRILEKVEALLGQVNATRARLARVPSILKRFRQSILSAACSGRLTGGWRKAQSTQESGQDVLDRIMLHRSRIVNARPTVVATHDHSTSPDADFDAPDLPTTWVWCRVAQIATVCLGGTPSRKEPTYWNGDVPWVSSGEVANCRIAATRERISNAGLANSSAKIYPKGSVLIAMIGEGKTRGQSAILGIEAATNQNAAGLLFDAGNVSPEYIWRWALGEYAKNRDEGRGGNQPALNRQKVRDLLVPLPPLAEQHEIVRGVDALFKLADAIEGRVAEATARADRLTQAILAKAFCGELVPTEAELARREGRAYEPASVLLDRIRAERAQAGQVPAQRRKRPPAPAAR
jgi:type I restriction enzyme S subunit